MGIAVEYDVNVECQRTHPLIVPKVEHMSLSWDGAEVLKKVKIIVPSVRFKKGTKQGPTKSIPAK